MQLDNKIFYAKLILIGEYTVINGGQALALPLKRFGGKWVDDSTNTESRKGLHKLYDFLVTQEQLGCLFDMVQFKDDIKKGLAFDSDIPQGYGLGSSGALVAAFYDRYVLERENDLSKLKSTLAEVESAFHGSSSGIDPLVSYLNKALWINGPISPIEVIESNLNLGSFFLIDTKITRSTNQFVTLWKNKMQVETAFVQINDEMSMLNNEAIQNLVSRNTDVLSITIEKISHLQGQYFHEMIPEQIKDLWQSQSHVLKLCGAGGGGMMLGYGSLPIGQLKQQEYFSIM